MKLSTRTVHILKNFAGINPSILFHKGHNQVTMSPMKTLLVRAAIAEEIPADFAIYDLSKFIGTLSLFSDPQIEVQKKYLTIIEKGQKVNFTFADPELIVIPTKQSLQMPSKDVEFKLVDAAVSQLSKAAGVLGLPHIVVTGDGEKVYIGVDKCNDPSADKYMVEVGQTKHSFRLAFLHDNFRILSGEYDVTLSKEGLGHFQGKDIEYWITTETQFKQFD